MSHLSDSSLRDIFIFYGTGYVDFITPTVLYNGSKLTKVFN